MGPPSRQGLGYLPQSPVSTYAPSKWGHIWLPWAFVVQSYLVRPSTRSKVVMGRARCRALIAAFFLTGFLAVAVLALTAVAPPLMTPVSTNRFLSCACVPSPFVELHELQRS